MSPKRRCLHHNLKAKYRWHFKRLKLGLKWLKVLGRTQKISSKSSPENPPTTRLITVQFRPRFKMIARHYWFYFFSDKRNDGPGLSRRENKREKGKKVTRRAKDESKGNRRKVENFSFNLIFYIIKSCFLTFRRQPRSNFREKIRNNKIIVPSSHRHLKWWFLVRPRQQWCCGEVSICDSWQIAWEISADRHPSPNRAK